jgi:DNA modification methylase
MELCFTMGHNYTGVDICKEFMNDNKKIKEYLIGNAAKNLLQPKKKRNITLLEQSSASVPNLADNSFDFTITSPPYWDFEEYGPEEEQLGTGKTYEQFLIGLQKCANENFRVVKPGAFVCWFVNDFRKNRKFYPYHIDTYNILEMAGFDPFNIYVVDLMNTPNKAFLQWVVKTRILPKQHENIIVCRKPLIK